VQAPQPSVEAVLWWFPDDTETLVAVPDPQPWLAHHVLPDASPTNVMLALTLASMRSLRSGQPFEALQGVTLRLAMHGARRFQTPPGDVGPDPGAAPRALQPYQGAQVFVFDAPLPEDVWALLNDYAGQRGHVAGVDVIRVDETLSGQTWRFWLAHPSPHVLVIATHDGFLAELLQRRADPEGPRAFNDETLWTLVASSSQPWAARQSPQGRVVLRAVPRGLRVHYLDANPEASAVLHQQWSQSRVVTEISPHSEGVLLELPTPLTPAAIVAIFETLGHRWR